MKSSIFKIISYTMLILAFMLFSLQIYYIFSQLFSIEVLIPYFIIGTFGFIYSLLSLIILQTVSRLQLFTAFHKKVMNTLRSLIYIIISLLFIILCFILVSGLLFTFDVVLIKALIIQFFTRSILLAVFYSVCIDLFFFSMSIKIKKGKNDEISGK